MYAYLKGKFTVKNPAQVYVDVNGVGYEVNISLNTFSHIQQLDEGQLFIHLQVKEDSHTLYGFFDKAEKDIFISLIGVSGIGASTARMVLSSLKPDELTKAIAQGNVKLLESIKGIGRKSAERLIVELRDKLGKQVAEGSFAEVMGNNIENDAVIALVSLGIARNVAELAVKKSIKLTPENNNLEDLIKNALKNL